MPEAGSISDRRAASDPRAREPAWPESTGYGSQAPRAGAFVAFFVLAGLASLAFADAVASMMRAWAQSSAHVHGALAAPTAVALVWARRSDWGEDGGVRWPGLVLLAGTLSTGLLARAAGIDAIAQFSFVGTLIAGFVTAFGATRAWRYAAPLGFLLFMPPLGDGIAAPLQLLTASMVEGMLALVGLEVEREGILLMAAGRTFAVTESCSGVRLLTAMMMIGFLGAFIGLNSPGRRLTALAAAFLLALAGNWLRVFAVIALTAWTGDAFGLTHDHFFVGGGAFFAAAGALAAVLASLRRGDSASDAPASASRTPPGNGRTIKAIAAAMMLVTIVWDRVVIAPTLVASLPVPGPVDEAWFSVVAGPGWPTTTPGANDWAPDLSLADVSKHSAHIASDGRRVDVATAWFVRDRPGREIAGYEIQRAAGLNAGTVETIRRSLPAFGAPMEVEVTVARDAAQGFAMTRVFVLDGAVFGDPNRLRLALAARRVRGDAPSGAVVFVYAFGASRAAAETALFDFLASSAPFTAPDAD